jgi:hypothetical protein
VRRNPVDRSSTVSPRRMRMLLGSALVLSLVSAVASARAQPGAADVPIDLGVGAASGLIKPSGRAPAPDAPPKTPAPAIPPASTALTTHTVVTNPQASPRRATANPMAISGTGLSRTGFGTVVVGGPPRAAAGVINGSSLRRK